MEFGNAMVFGGTGMLSNATKWMASRSKQTVVFGRKDRKLASLAKTDGAITKNLDYNDLDALSGQVSLSYEAYGAFDIVLAWIHKSSPRALSVIIETISKLQPTHQWSLIVVKGSSDNLSDINSFPDKIKSNCSIKVVKLGFILEGDSSRWLTHDEISSGVVGAIKTGDEETIIGTIEPWDLRP